jgi:hypothetical protein
VVGLGEQPVVTRLRIEVSSGPHPRHP